MCVVPFLLCELNLESLSNIYYVERLSVDIFSCIKIDNWFKVGILKIAAFTIGNYYKKIINDELIRMNPQR